MGPGLPMTGSMTIDEGRDPETAARTALAAIEQMFDEAMTYIGVVHQGFMSASADQDADDERDPSVDPAQERASSAENSGRTAA